MSDITSGNLISFALTIFILLFLIIIYFTIGGSVLYACKVAQSNILPTETNCSPYTSTPVEIESILTNIFITATKPPLSEKIKFSSKGWNEKNYLLDMFREYKTTPKSNYMVNYFIALMEGLVGFNYSSLNTAFSFINYLPEPIILFVGPIILLILSIHLVILNCLYLVYLWFANMTWFFKTNKNSDPNKSPDWEYVTIWSPLSFLGGCLIMFVFIFFFIIFFIFAWGFMPILSVMFTITSLFTYQATDENDKPIGLIDILTKFFKFYKVTITSTICALVILSTFANLGLTSALAVLVAVSMIFFGVVSTTLFKEIHPKDISPLVSNAQATKTCKFKPVSSSNNSGWFCGGENIGKEIRKISKKIGKI